MKAKYLIVGLDLSFNSTGMTFLTNTGAEFHRLVYDSKPKTIQNINQHTYYLPSNVPLNSIVDETDFYSEDQALITVKMMVITKRLMALIHDKINRCEPENFYVNIEGFISSDSNGFQQLRILSGLIILQGLMRSELIKTKLANNFEDFKLYITSPSALKLFFTGKGDADKFLMLEHFNDFYDGNKLLPDTKSLAKVNDVIDSFALAINAFHRIYFNSSYMELFKEKVVDGKLYVKKKKKKKVAKKQLPDMIKTSIPQLD